MRERNEAWPDDTAMQHGADGQRASWESHQRSLPGAARSAAASDRRPLSTNGQGAEVHPVRDFGSVACQQEVDLVLFRFTSFGRLAHFRHWLLSLPHVSSVRIATYGDQTACFVVGVTAGIPSSSLVLPGTRLIASDGRRLELCVQT